MSKLLNRLHGSILQMSTSAALSLAIGHWPCRQQPPQNNFEKHSGTNLTCIATRAGNMTDKRHLMCRKKLLQVMRKKCCNQCWQQLPQNNVISRILLPLLTTVHDKHHMMHTDLETIAGAE